MAYFFKLGIENTNMKKAYLSLMLILVNIVMFAQEKSTDINVDVNKSSGSNWYASPWVWVIGAAIFILLLIALVGGGNRRSGNGSGEKVTMTKTVRRDEV